MALRCWAWLCNNSGGSLIKRGPAYSEMAFDAQRDASGEWVLVNHSGIELGSTPEQFLSRLDDKLATGKLRYDQRHASDNDYAERVRKVAAGYAFPL